ncbi:hypothetical protein LMG23992_05570 [Cupriavidus laharis]|uniref:Uncharacterized protein n=1 Tax=Cupriavidus laharis TaxID=151654 RepID=A0ABM8XYM5_9BURK|nr:hypothetical protein [Cupriavidus laharis]CAG9185540.1 hypothetical protein LMG23992_05570 [Cupriavidus laharis]
MDFEALALELCTSYSRIPEVSPPFEAGTLHWHGQDYFYVSGWGEKQQRRLLEVFRKTKDVMLEPLPAFQYPLPFRDLFPQDFRLLYRDAPWEDAGHKR